ncbi:MAG: MGH1-like glycoside hydrolase domain-containing protein, partial [Aestuariivirga sp.]
MLTRRPATPDDRRREAVAIMQANDRGGYTVPTAGLYPFQWNWDSAFAAAGFLTFDEPRAWRELEMLFSGQWADGLVPHIIFHQPSDTYFPGPDVWGTNHSPPTSGITQPPVAAIAAKWMFDAAEDRALARAKLEALFPKMLAWHRWWAAARDPDGTGLVAILHNWETGMDNSPVWDGPFKAVPGTKSPYVRKDTGHVDPSMRPKKADYDRYVHLVETYRACRWDPAAMWKAAPFKVAHAGVNAILLRAETDLATLADALGLPAEAAEIRTRAGGMAAAIGALWDPATSAYQSVDLLKGERIPAAT